MSVTTDTNAGAAISSIGTALPRQRVSNEWLGNRLGVRIRSTVNAHRPYAEPVVDRPNAEHATRGARRLDILREASDRAAKDHRAVDCLDRDLVRVDATVIGERVHYGSLEGQI